MAARTKVTHEAPAQVWVRGVLRSPYAMPGEERLVLAEHPAIAHYLRSGVLEPVLEDDGTPRSVPTPKPLPLVEDQAATVEPVVVTASAEVPEEG